MMTTGDEAKNFTTDFTDSADEEAEVDDGSWSSSDLCHLGNLCPLWFFHFL